MESPIALKEGWSNTRKITFRFSFAFFILFIFPYPLDQNPLALMGWWNEFLGFYYQATTWLTHWSGSALFGVEVEMSTRTTGSGDTLFSWVQNGLFVVLAVIGGTVWSIFDRKRKSYSRLWKWFHLLMVYNLAYWLFVYGLIKIFDGQFSGPGIARLLETFGESSPMRIMWTFMGTSESYTNFSGWSEAIAGFLLLFRRTRTLGALAAAGVMLNVFVLNMTYDVPVKLFSFRLILAGLWIALADHKRLLSFFLFNKSVPAQNWESMFTTAWKNYLLLGLQILIMGWHIYFYVDYGLNNAKLYGADRGRHLLYGIHDVDTFVLNGDTIPPLLTDTVRWKKGFMDLPGFGGNMLWGIKMMNDDVIYYSAEIDSIKNQLILKPRGDTVNIYPLDYHFEGKNLSLKGIIKSDTLQITTTYFNPDDFIIRSRGFNWVSEVPFNRRVPYRE